MPLSENVNGEVLDWHFKKRETDTLFSVGHHPVATLYNMGGRKWTVVPVTPLLPFIFQGKADGFRSRYDACAYALSIWRAQRLAERASW